MQYRPAKRTCYCRGCDKEITPNTEKIITFYSFRNCGQYIHICGGCVSAFNELMNEDSEVYTREEVDKMLNEEYQRAVFNCSRDD